MGKPISKKAMVPELATDRPKARVLRTLGRKAGTQQTTLSLAVPRFTAEQRRQLLIELRSDCRVDLLERLALPAVRPLRTHERDDPRVATPAVRSELAGLLASVRSTLDFVSRALYGIKITNQPTKGGRHTRTIGRPSIDQIDILQHLRALLDEAEFDQLHQPEAGPDESPTAIHQDRRDGVSPLEQAREALIALEAVAATAASAADKRAKKEGQRRRRAAPEPIIAIWRAVQEGQKPDAMGRRPIPLIPFENGLGSKFRIIVDVCFESWGFPTGFDHGRAIESARKLLDEEGLSP